jgi:hypothetical protein
VLTGLIIFGSELAEDLSGGTILSVNDTTSGFIALLLLHGAYIIGYSIAWRWEGLGGLIAIVGILLAQLISPSPTSMFLGQLLFTIPGFFYILYWFFSRRQGKTEAHL